MAERWRPIPGHDGYDVSDLGRVRSWLSWRGLPVPRVLSLTTRPDGRLEVRVHAPQRQQRKVHHLVAEAWLGPRPTGHHVRHLNGDHQDNQLSNLAYGTPSDNRQDQMRHGTHWQVRKTHCPHGHPYDETNTHVTRRGHRVCKDCWRAANRLRAMARKEQSVA